MKSASINELLDALGSEFKRLLDSQLHEASSYFRGDHSEKEGLIQDQNKVSGLLFDLREAIKKVQTFQPKAKRLARYTK